MSHPQQLCRYGAHPPATVCLLRRLCSSRKEQTWQLILHSHAILRVTSTHARTHTHTHTHTRTHTQTFWDYIVSVPLASNSLTFISACVYKTNKRYTHSNTHSQTHRHTHARTRTHIHKHTRTLVMRKAHCGIYYTSWWEVPED